jgi:hypothetical protein
MQFQNVIKAVVILATVDMAQPQTLGQARRSLNLDCRQDATLQPNRATNFLISHSWDIGNCTLVTVPNVFIITKLWIMTIAQQINGAAKRLRPIIYNERIE